MTHDKHLIFHKKRVRVLNIYSNWNSDTTSNNLRDNAFPKVQKFQKTLRIVYTSNPSGLSEEEEMNMPVAIHCGETKQMDYQYRSYNPNKWKLYNVYLHLKKIPIFLSASVPPIMVTTETINNVTPIYTAKAYNESRGAGRGKKDPIVEQLKKEKESCKRSREDEKDKTFEGMMSDMADIKKMMKKKSHTTIITKAIKMTDDE